MSNPSVLWVNVVLQAVLDGTADLSTFNGETKDSKRHHRNAERAKVRAREWFNLSNPDFIEVCSLAGLDPERTLEQATATFTRCDLAHADGKRFNQPKPTELKTSRPPARVYTAHGLTMTLPEWSKHLSIPADTLRSRLERHSPEASLRRDFAAARKVSGFNKSKAGRPAKRYTVDGVAKTVSQWATQYGIERATLAARLRKGYSIEDALAFGRTAHRGAGSDLKASEGTGAGSTAQETPEIDFSDEASR